MFTLFTVIYHNHTSTTSTRQLRDQNGKIVHCLELGRHWCPVRESYARLVSVFGYRNLLADQLLHDSLAYGTVSCDTDFIVTDCVQVRAERSEECVVWGRQVAEEAEGA